MLAKDYDLQAMKSTVYILLGIALLAVVIWLGERMRIIGFHYPQVIETQPLNNPVTVVSLKGNVVTLQDGRTIALHDFESDDFAAVLKESNNRLDLETQSGGTEIDIYANRDGWICGTPWVCMIEIPIIPDPVYRNRRQFVGFGKVKEIPVLNNGK